jgi:hypothetical protein
MEQQVYKELFEVMKNRRGPYTGVEVPEFYPMVEELFTPPEAEVNNVMPKKPVTAAEIAAEMDRSEIEIKAILEAMADKGLCKTYKQDGVRLYQGEPFMGRQYRPYLRPGVDLY